MEKGASAVVVVPSLTLMRMFAAVPTLAAVGVPESWPFAVLNVAHWGRFAMENVSLSPSASLAVGTNMYVEPAAIVVDGVPEIVGAAFVGGGAASRAAMVMRNGPIESVALPSETVISMSSV